MSEVFLQLLAQFDLQIQGQPVDDAAWTRKKSKTLLKLLALAPGRKLHREPLIEALWPNSDADTGLNNLHKIVHATRRTLEPDLKTGSASRFLFTQDSFVALAPAPLVEVDIDRFEALATAALKSADPANLRQALDLYRGDLLPEDLYDDWASVRREQLRRLAERLLETLAHQQPDAEEYPQRLLQMNPAHEDAHLRLMRLHLRRGDRQRALEQYRLCREALRSELAAEPGPEIRSLYEELAAGGGPAPNPVPPVPLPSRRRFPVLALLPLAGGTAWWLWPTKNSAVRSLAILPFRTQGNDPNLPAIAEGLTEGLINGASRLSGVRVMARATMFAFQGRTDPLGVARELKVSTVLSGRLRQNADQSFTVALELVDVADGSRLWGRQFVALPREFPSLQQTLNSALAAEIAPPASEPPPPSRPAGDGLAYQLYLSGRYFANQRTAAGLTKARDYYRQAIDRDPRYALAYAGLADCLGLLGVADARPGDYFPPAREAAQRALALDDSLAEAHTSLAMIRALYDWDFPGAEAQFRRAIELNSGYSTAHHWFAVHLGAMGRFDEAQNQFQRARDLDPLSPIIQLNSAYPAYFQHRYPAALAFVDKAIELQPSFTLAWRDKIVMLERKGDFPAAAQAAATYLKLTGDADLAAPFAAAQNPSAHQAALRRWLEALELRRQSRYVSSMELAGLTTRAALPDRAFSWLERAVEDRVGMAVYLGVDPEFDPLRSDPRFGKILARLGLLIPQN